MNLNYFKNVYISGIFENNNFKNITNPSMRIISLSMYYIYKLYFVYILQIL